MYPHKTTASTSRLKKKTQRNKRNNLIQKHEHTYYEHNKKRYQPSALLSNMTTCRAEITGQFNFDNPFSAWNNTEVKVERELAAMAPPPPNWSSFCDSADDALQPLLATKKSFKLMSSIFYASFFAVFAGLVYINNFNYGLLKFAAVPYVLLMIPFGIFYFCTRSKLKKTMSDVEKTCQQHSDGNSRGFRYTLHSEHWGGCNKPHVKRYFITVHAPNDAEGGNNADIEQPVVAVPVAAYVPAPAAIPPTNDAYQNTPSSVAVTSGGGGKGPSIFDQLN